MSADTDPTALGVESEPPERVSPRLTVLLLVLLPAQFMLGGLLRPERGAVRHWGGVLISARVFQDLATGLVIMTQKIVITMGTPIMSAVATSAMVVTGTLALLDGLSVAVLVNAGLVLVGVLTSALFLRGPKGAEV